MDKKKTNLIQNKKDIPKVYLEFIPILKNGNCSYRTYRTISSFLFSDESHHKDLLEEIYENPKIQKNETKSFFIKDAPDEVIVNVKVDMCVEKIKEDKFHDGVIEISLFMKLSKKNVNIYKDNEENEN